MSHWIIHSADLLKNTKLIPEQNICQSWQVIEWFIQEAKFEQKLCNVIDNIVSKIIILFTELLYKSNHLKQ